MNYKNRSVFEGVVEAACVISSIMTLALVTSAYQRYETQVRGGRTQVWSCSDRSLSSLNGELQVTSVQRRWIKVMEEDNPVGRMISFAFWFLFIFVRIVALVLASLFFPWTVLAVCGVHYLFSLMYILPSPECTSSIPAKILLAAVYVFCLVEVRIHFRKSCLLYILFFTFSILENIALTLLWALWADWSEPYFYYCLSIIAVTQSLSIVFIFVYFKYFQPRVKRLEPM